MSQHDVWPPLISYSHHEALRKTFVQFLKTKLTSSPMPTDDHFDLEDARTWIMFFEPYLHSSPSIPQPIMPPPFEKQTETSLWEKAFDRPEGLVELFGAGCHEQRDGDMVHSVFFVDNPLKITLLHIASTFEQHPSGGGGGGGGVRWTEKMSLRVSFVQKSHPRLTLLDLTRMVLSR